ncbi:nucleotidyltransferase domain-containing protein [Litorimonas sp. WD9-15]|uniref:nucleotidyltransferase domain-containing protein n=1 Tax=Litorimonas sp. WD9-15 TaxID=3418716 RepID=UPI003CFE11DF
MAEFKSSISDSVRTEILSQLEGIERDHKVEILFAVESGSRAWGFPSPDSDYDVRFVYAHDPDWYLSLTPGRDVIELPIDDELDINGWDIRKALNLMLKPNPVMLEWLSSPIRYRWSSEICGKLEDFSRGVSHETACLNHYLSLTLQQWEKHIEGQSNVKLKKYFYATRPAMNICWLRTHPDIIPPMNFQALMNGLDLTNELKSEIQALIEAKSRAKEIGLAPRVTVVDDFIKAEINWAKGTVSKLNPVRFDRREEANQLFRNIVKDCYLYN